MSAGRRTTGWGWFAAWFTTGAAFTLVLLGAFTIGIFVLPVAAAATIYLATRRGSAVGIAGLISGLGIPLLLVAAFNRNGPGEICTGNATNSSCTEEMSPWPWLIVALVLITLGVVVFIVSSRRRSTMPGVV